MRNKRTIKLIAKALILVSMTSIGTIQKANASSRNDYFDGFEIVEKAFKSKVKFKKADGTYAKNEWINKTGYSPVWGQYNDWFYFNENGIMDSDWIGPMSI